MTTPFDVFASTAPEVPDWFEHASPAADYPFAPAGPMPDDYFSPDKLVPPDDETSQAVSARRLAHDWFLDPIYDLPAGPEWACWRQDCQAFWNGRHTHAQADKLARLVQWRMVYAQAMFEERCKYIPNDGSPMVERLAGYALSGLLCRNLDHRTASNVAELVCQYAKAVADELGKYNLG